MKKTIITLLLLGVGICGCAAKKENLSQSLAPSWAGTYVGTLPCASCEGIHTALTLNLDQTYVLTSRYLGQADSTFEETGRFSWLHGGNTIKLQSDGGLAPLYQLSGDTLVMLNADGLPNTGPLAKAYVLHKQSLPACLLGTHWKLVEVMGEAVTPFPGEEEPFIYLDQTGQLNGFGGCNRVFGAYELKAKNQIDFANLGSTRMACPDRDHQEQKFFEALSQTKSYSCDGQTLVLHTTRANAVKFVAVPKQ